VTGAFPNGCRDTALAFLTVYQLPIITVPSGSICNGQNFTFNPSGAATYTFLSGSANVSPSVTTSYSVLGTSSVGCVSALPGVGNVTVFANPNIGIAAQSNTICNGELRTFTATGGTYYTWGGLQNTPQVSLTFALGTTTLYVAGIDANGCANTSSLALIITNCTGLTEYQSTELLRAYPNPFQEQFNIDCVSQTRVRVIDVFGKLIIDQVLSAGTQTINLKEQAAGIYVVELQSGMQHQVMKVQKIN
jgi:hypothetical protein